MSCGNYAGVLSDPVPNASSDEIICRGSNSSYTGTNWFNFWSQDSGFFCSSVFKNLLYGGTTGTTGAIGYRTYNPNNLQRVRDNMNNVFAQYQISNTLGDVNTPGFNAFQETILATCQDIPGACEDFQNIYCAQCTNADIASTILLTRLCGCKAPPLDPAFNINNPSCAPLCNRVNSIQNINPTTGASQICTADVCVINDINITATNNSNVQGGITFSQLCGSCKQSCTCIVSGVNLNDTLISTGLTNAVQFNTACQNATCYQDDASGNLVPVVCPVAATFTAPEVPVAVNTSFIYLIIGIFIIVVLGILIYFILSRE